jgi:hypothetical protein
MQSTASTSRPVASRSSGRISGPSPQRSRPRREREPRAQGGPLGHYADAHGRKREILADAGAAGSVLVVDRDATTHGDSRLVAHLAADEPVENAAIVCAHYLRDAACARGRCRRLTRDDGRVSPLLAGGHRQPANELASLELGPEAIDSLGNRYRLEPRPSRMSIPELRWCRYPSQPGDGRTEPVSVRDAVACLESYEPVYALTRRALADRDADEEISTATLRAELRRMQESPIVLNRRLREVVLATARRNGLSMSEIAYRCGRVKRDGRGNESGETSWLARRIGLLSEAGRGKPTPWIHSDVLALIARRGLAVAPREVESA